MSKLITIVGITGNQGASVAEAFLNEPGWKIRGISRDPSKPSSKEWSDKGAEVVAADLDDVNSLKAAFKGSNAIFGVTDFWQQVAIPGNHQKAAETGTPINVIAHDAEVQQGKNIVDAAAATEDTLEMLVLSVLSDSKKWSHGKITWNYHFDGKWRFVEYLEKNYPSLYKKTSQFHAAFYITNLEQQGPRKNEDGLYTLSFPVDGNKQIPMLDPRRDTGPLVKGLVLSTPGKILTGYSGTISPEEIAEFLSKETGKKVQYFRGSVDFLDQAMPGGIGRELGEMFEYISDPGYYGGEEAAKALGYIAPEDLGVSGLSDIRTFLQGLNF